MPEFAALLLMLFELELFQLVHLFKELLFFIFDVVPSFLLLLQIVQLLLLLFYFCFRVPLDYLGS